MESPVPRKRGFSLHEENFPGCDITPEEWEFIQTIEAYKRRYQIRYPSWREVLKLLCEMGYRRVEPASFHVTSLFSSPAVVTDMSLRKEPK